MPKLAIRGGTPVRQKPFAPWPVFGAREERALCDVLRSRNWGGVGFANKSTVRKPHGRVKVSGVYDSRHGESPLIP